MIKYYINRGEEDSKELYSAYKIYVTDQKGFADEPTPKDDFVENWADSNGQNVYERLEKVYKPQNVEIDFLAVGNIPTIKANVHEFLTYLKTVTAAFEGAEYGSSTFNMWNDIWNTVHILRYIGFDEGAKLTYKTIIDNQNPNEQVSGYAFTLKFVIDKPTVL